MNARAAVLCETCGSSLELESVSGFCPYCLLGTALEAQSAEPAGSRFEDYEILNQVARGGMGVVYRAHQRAPSRVVALKMILPGHIGSTQALARFRGEAEAAASLDHAGILPVFAVGEHDGVPFYSMKFAEGGSLAARLAEFADKPHATAALVAQLARAIAHAHERGILHRDLKPGNVLFDGADKPFVSDFGLARWLEREGDLTQTLAILGTPFYMAPEQGTNAHSITAAADIYSLGAILFHLLTGQPPFRGDNAMQVLRNAAERPATRPRVLNRKVPADLETICLKCLEKNPASRYSSAEALADDLDRFLAGRTIRARRANPLTHATRWVRRNRSLAALALALVALICALFFVARFARPPTTSPAQTAHKSIAVLPFENLTGDKDDAALLREIQDDLLVSLSKIRDLKVISRRSVMRYQDTARDLPAIGKTLGVASVLEGTFRRRGDRAQINVQLIDTVSGEQLWAENYERATADAFALQRDLATHVAFALKAKISPHETTRLQRRPTENGEAYLLYLQATDILHAYGRGPGDLTRAEELLEKAIALDPSFALAFAQLAQIETELFSGYDPGRRAKAKAAADAALRLQLELPEAHLALGRYYWIDENPNGEADYAQAMRELAIAQRGLPNDPEVYSNIGRVERHLGQWTDSTAHLAKAVALDPNNEERWHRLFFNHELTRNYPAASEALERVIALAPDTWSYKVHRGYLQLFWKGDTRALEEMLTQPPSGEGPQGFVTDWRFHIALLLGKYSEAERMLQQDPRENFTEGWIEPIPKAFLFGQLYYRTGDKEKARENFEQARPSIEQSVQQRPLEGAWHLVLAEVYAGLGRKDDAIREGLRATEIIPESKDPWAGLGMLDGLAAIYMMVGERERALSILEHSVTSPGGVSVEQLRISPFWAPLRNDPRFQKLLGSAPGQSVDDKSIAVLPFENLSEDKSNDYLASGIHDEVLANLSRLGQLKVISPNSVLPYKGGGRNLREIGNALAVRTVLEGEVRPVGNRAHISVQLIDTTNDAQIWADSFEREMTDLFSVQSDLAVRIATALQVKLSPAERASLETPPTRDAEAYDFYLRGRELLHGIAGLGKRDENLSTAIDLLNRAVARDPNFALGYCLLAELHLARFRVSRSGNMLSGHDPADLEKVRSNLEIALRIAPDLGEAHLVRGMYFYRTNSDYKSASAEFSIARRDLPNNAECLHLSGLLERRLGRWNDGLLYLVKAVSLDPQNATAREDLASTYYLNRNFPEAERALDQAIAAIPEHANFFRLKKAQVGLMKGDLVGARAALQSLPPDYECDGLVAYYRALLALYLRDFAEADRILVETFEKLGAKKTEWWVTGERAFVARAEGDRAKAEVTFQTALRVKSEMRKKTPDDPGVLSMIALLQAGLGRKDEALREIGKAMEILPMAADAIDGPAVARNQALVYAWCGERDRALEQLAGLAKMPSGPDPGDLRFNPSWDVLRGDARFDAIVAAATEPIELK